MKLTVQQSKVLQLMITYLDNDIANNGAMYIRTGGLDIKKQFTFDWFVAIRDNKKTFYDTQDNKRLIGTTEQIKNRLNLMREHYMDNLKLDITI